MTCEQHIVLLRLYRRLAVTQYGAYFRRLNTCALDLRLHSKTHDSDRGASDTDLAQDKQPTILPGTVPVSIMDTHPPDPPAVISSLLHVVSVTLESYSRSSQTGHHTRVPASCQALR